MPAQQTAVQFDVLDLDMGEPIPSSGEGERYRLAFPPTATSTDSNSGDNIQQATPFVSGILTVSCYQTDAAHTLMLAFFARQQAEVGTGVTHPGSLALASRPGGLCAWSHAYVTQQSEIVSSREAQVVTWTLSIVDGIRQGL